MAPSPTVALVSKMLSFSRLILFSVLIVVFRYSSSTKAQDVVGCGGFVQSDVDINYSLIQMKLLTKQGIIKSQTECAPNNGYFLIPLYDKGVFMLKIEPPVGWSFDPNSVELNIDGTTDRCSKGEDINFVFTGFTLAGKVVSKGRGLGPSGVEISLQESAGDKQRKTVTAEGGFFSQVMPGKYHVKASHSSWTFENAEAEVTVESSNVDVVDKIVVSGYDVKGHVLSDGEPIQDVGFLLFSKSVDQKNFPGCEDIPPDVVEIIKTKMEVDVPLCRVKSGVDGLFVFPSIPSGEYTLVPYYQGELITFDVVPSKLTFSVNYKSVVLKTPFQVHGFSVTGQVLTAEGQGIADVSITAGEEITAKTTAEGVYVLNNVTAGAYTIQASKEHFFFNSIKVQVTPNTPRLPEITPQAYHLCGALKFDEFPPGVTQLKGRKMILQTEGASIATRSMSTSVDENGNFCFKVSPGTHMIQPIITMQEVAAGLALTPKEQVVTIKNSPVLGITFSQFRATVTGTVKCIGGSCSGVSITLQSVSNPGLPKAEVQFFSLESHKEMVDSFDLPKGTKTFCLKEPGVYNLMPRSCHQFEQEVFKYNTSAPSVLTLTAIKHLLSGTVKTQEPMSDITIKIRSLKSKEVTILGPLKPESNEKKDSSDANSSKPDEEKQQLSYNFSHWGRRGEEFEITPVSSELLFYPENKLVTISDDCPAAWAEFEGRKGVFIEGQITPPLSGVQIVISSAGEQPISDIKVETDTNGKYRVGPLHGGVEYSLAASKAGFVLSPAAGKKGDFQALKLGQIDITVTDEDGQPLSAVLLSLSAGQFRSNNLTLENGSMVFANLGPGQYFFRPMLKEYTFTPPSQMIDVGEGSIVQLQVKGKRVAFSCFGAISSLNGEPEKGVAVEAIGLESCESFQEETVSDQEGQYRLRGLQVSSTDLQNVNMIAFRHINQFEITGNVDTDSKFVSSLKVTLSPESNPETPVFTTPVSVASYFQFPSVPNDGQVYIVRLESSLSSLNYQYIRPESTVTATGVRAHVTFKFEPQPRKVEPEPSQGSFLTLPLLVILIVLAVNHNKLIPFIQQVPQFIQGVSADQLQAQFEDPYRNKKKPKDTRRR
ncbi:hypothetical protein pdam_00020157 [Pocillopora damicornis]|uniref:ER membrane protein complex subunit 7 beta-sandwich domain-containing protein n=1 Tax=Pocillopora damicornis TaxID=46731 RepID=A0A3M6TPE9_POCDA|nr:hypothetical protein pdam_00020157 [Pocillopora damicornis]